MSSRTNCFVKNIQKAWNAVRDRGTPGDARLLAALRVQLMYASRSDASCVLSNP